MRKWSRNLLATAAVLVISALSQTTARAAGEDAQWFMTLGGVSNHERETLAPGRRWNESHASLGLERRVAGIPWDASADKLWQLRLTAGTLEDSRALWGSYAGVGLLRELMHHGPLRLQAGVYTNVYYRSISWNGAMKLVPAILPTLSLTDHASGFGLNVVWVPPARWAGRDTVSTVLVQLNYRLEQ